MIERHIFVIFGCFVRRKKHAEYRGLDQVHSGKPIPRQLQKFGRRT